MPLCFVCSHRCDCSLCDAFLVASLLRNKVGFHGKRYWQKADVNSCLLTENKIMCVLFFLDFFVLYSSAITFGVLYQSTIHLTVLLFDVGFL